MDEYEKRQFVEDVMHKLMEHHEKTHTLDLADERLLGTRIRIVSDDGRWLEIELLDSKAGKVRLTSGEMFAMKGGTFRANDSHQDQPVEGRIVGSLKNVGPLPSHDGDMQILDGIRLNPSVTLATGEILPLTVKHWHVLIYEVGNELRVLNGACAVTMTLASGKVLDGIHDRCEFVV
ncbi:hypothetical protein VT84_24775 [Gemmata sp. SH-PL17]|uniref:hypothetical protein n=1 Tax=Gemmata sp. SH-PL17 TaxID=1630693 RepID=UPI00078EE427|nr:hypothetical protein [Gemmata sp. SH-PL17]AMV27639.1 hypothetical protein VT84_24775 [Gemmata sp. SH-PL17]